MNSADDAGDGTDAARRLALKALAGRDLLAGELEATLAREGHPPTAAATVLDELKARGLLDEDRIARQRIHRWRREGRSDADITARLTGAGVAEPTIERLLHDRDAAGHDDAGSVSGFDAAIAAVRRRGRGLDTASPEGLRRLAARMGRAGFDPDTIRRALRHCGLDDALLDDD